MPRLLRFLGLPPPEAPLDATVMVKLTTSTTRPPETGFVHDLAAKGDALSSFILEAINASETCVPECLGKRAFCMGPSARRRRRPAQPEPEAASWPGMPEAMMIPSPSQSST